MADNEFYDDYLTPLGLSRNQASLGKFVKTVYKEGRNITRLSLAKVIKVNYKYNTVDVVTNRYKDLTMKNSNDEGRYSARLPVDFGGRLPNGKAYGTTTLVTVNSTVLIGFIEGEKENPIVINIYHTPDTASEVTNNTYTSGDESDESIQNELWKQISVHPSMTYKATDGRGNQEVTFTGRTFLYMTDTDQDNAYVSDYGFNFQDLPSVRNNQGELREPTSALAPTILYVHQNVNQDHKLAFFIKSDGTFRMSTAAKGEIAVSFLEMRPDGTISMRRNLDTQIPEGESSNYSELAINPDGSITQTSGDSKFEVGQDGVLINGIPLDSESLSELQEAIKGIEETIEQIENTLDSPVFQNLDELFEQVQGLSTRVDNFSRNLTTLSLNVTTHIEDEEVHVSTADRLKWDNKPSLEQLNTAISVAKTDMQTYTNNAINTALGGTTKERFLTAPIVVAEQGGKNVYPEGTLAAYQSCVDNGLPTIHVAVQQNREGALVVHQNLSLNNTTGVDKQVGSVSTAYVRNASVANVLPSWNGQPLITLNELFEKLDRSAVYFIESVDAKSAAKIKEAVIAHQLQDNTVIISTNITELEEATENGIAAAYKSDAASSVIVNERGIKYVVCSNSVPDTYISQLVASNIRVLVYTVNTQSRLTELQSQGVAGVISSDPLWVKGISATSDEDYFDESMYYHGHLSNNSDRGIFVNGGWGYNEGAPGELQTTLQGWAGKLGETFEIALDITFTTESEGSAEIIFKSPGDDFAGSGYAAILKTDGTIQLKNYLDDQAELLGEQVGSPVEGTVRLQIVYSNGNIEFTRLDTGGTISATNNTHTGAYLFFGRVGAGTVFSNVRITR